MNRGEIDIKEVAEIFDLKTRTMREYRRLKIIVPVRRIRGKDAYLRSEVTRAAKICAENSFMTLTEVAEIVIKDRDNRRKRNLKSKPKTSAP